MTRVVIAAALALAACKSSQKAAPPADPAPINAIVKGLADRACGCNNDPGCVKLVRVDWDAGKQAWLAARQSFPAGAAVAFDSDLQRLRMCGDAAGVTIWLQL